MQNHIDVMNLSGLNGTNYQKMLFHTFVQRLVIIVKGDFLQSLMRWTTKNLND